MRFFVLKCAFEWSGAGVGAGAGARKKYVLGLALCVISGVRPEELACHIALALAATDRGCVCPPLQVLSPMLNLTLAFGEKIKQRAIQKGAQAN